MPFVSESQRRACYAQMRRDLKAGREPRWKCSEYGSKSKRSRKRSTKRRSMKRKRSKEINKKVYTGPRGGKYVIYDGKKIYI